MRVRYSERVDTVEVVCGVGPESKSRSAYVSVCGHGKPFELLWFQHTRLKS